MEYLLSVIESLNYNVTKNDGQYIEAVSIHKWDSESNKAISREGMRVMNINVDSDYNFVSIKEDGGTRTVFNGFIETSDQLKLIDKLTKIL